MRKLLSYFLLTLSSCWCAPILAQAAATPQLSLHDAVLLALRYNPTVRTAEIQRVIDKFNLRLAQNQYEVNYALNGSATYSQSTQNTVGSTSSVYNVTPSAALNQSAYGTTVQVNAVNAINANTSAGAHYNPGVTLAVTQPLLRGFGKAINMAPLYNAQDTELINQLNLKNSVVNTVTQVVAEYTSLAQAQNTLSTQKLALQNSIATLKQYSALVKAGRNAPADLVQFKAAVANQQLALQAQQINVQQAQLALLSSLGLDPNTAFVITDAVNLPPLALPNLEASIAAALRNNINYVTQKINLRILERNYHTAQDQQRWVLNLTANASVGGGAGGSPNAGLASLGNGSNHSQQVALQLAVPIDDMSLQQQLVQAKTTLEQARVTVAATERQVVSDVTNAYNNLLNQQQQITQARAATQLAAANLQIAYAKAKYDRMSPFEVSSIQAALTSAQIALINTRENYINTLANFDSMVDLTLTRWHLAIRD